MSVPFRIVTCTNCDHLQATSLMLIGFFVWKDSQDREALFSREFGICRNCCTVKPIERLPNRAEFNEAEEAFLAGYWRKRSLRKKIYRSFEKSLIEEALDPTSGFEVLRLVMALRRRPVCLACGSPNVSTMPIPYGHDTASEELVATGTIHPECGGELLLRGSGGARVAVETYKNVYDIHGQFVERSRK